MLQPRLHLFAAGLALTALAVAAAIGQPLSAQEPARPTSTVIASQPGWMDTGIMLAAGERVTITATGTPTWDGGRTLTGPDGVAVESCATVAPALPIGALLARLNGGAPVLASGSTFSGPGRVELAYNDCPDQFFDNQGTFTAVLDVLRPVAAAPTPAPTASVLPEPAAAPEEQPADGGRDSTGLPRWLLLLPVACLIGAAVVVARRTVFARRWRFEPTARLESSAWIAPMRLGDLQGGRFPKQALSIGGPDADIDFGLSEVRARLVPLPDGATRLELTGESGQIFVNNQAVIIGRRLVTRQRVRIGTREFVYLEERGAHASSDGSGDGKDKDVLSQSDPRSAA